MIDGGGRALILHAQRLKVVSYVQLVVRELSDSFDSWIHIIKYIDIQGPYVALVELITDIKGTGNNKLQVTLL